MEKNGFPSNEREASPRLSLAEEQRRAFEEDQRRLKLAIQPRWRGFLFRN